LSAALVLQRISFCFYILIYFGQNTGLLRRQDRRCVNSQTGAKAIEPRIFFLKKEAVAKLQFCNSKLLKMQVSPDFSPQALA
jgi:hypothetical protein